MKKTILHCLLFTVCFAAVTSCSKEVKAPIKSTSVTKTTPTNNSNTNQGGQNDHHCGNHSGSGSGYGG